MASPALIAAALAVLAPQGPQSPLAVARKMSTDYKKAMISEDLGYFEKNSTPDLVFIDAQGRKMQRKDALEGVRQGFEMIKKIQRLDEKVVSARRTKDGLVSVSDVYIEAMVEMGGKSGKMVSRMRNEALVVPRGNAWQYKTIKLLKEDTKIDGKSMAGM